MGADDDARLVLDMLSALVATFGKPNAEDLRPFFTDDAVYHNIPMDPAVGIDDTITFIENFCSMFDGMRIETRHLAVGDGVVLTERVDTLTMGGIDAELPVMGTFELRGDKISAWRDYFDLGQITRLLTPET